MAGQALSKQQDDPRPVNVAPFLRTDGEGVHRLAFSVEGVHCAGCIQKIESSLKQFPEIKEARLNFSTRRLSVAWSGVSAFSDRIVSTLTGLGYKVTPFDISAQERGADKQAKDLLLCLGVAGFASGNIMLLSFALWMTDIETMGVATRDFLHWVSALIAIPAVAFAGRPFFASAWAALKSKRTNMDVPISVALILTLLVSLFEMSEHGNHTYFDSAVMLMFFLLIGRYLDYIARAKARWAASDLLSMMAGTATIIEDGKPKAILIRDVAEGMVLQVAMGEYIAANGIVLSGETEIDSSLVTGESLPSSLKSGDEVLSGCLNLSAPITVKVLRRPEDSQIGDMVRLMEKAEQSQAKYVRIADRVARLYTPVVHLMALLAFCGWVFVGSMAWQDALMIAATVLIITCPCALALAVPVVQVMAVGQLMKRGIMVRSGDVLERVATVDTVIFDKTGTLTHGKPMLINASDIPADVFALAAAMASQSRHPLSKALAKAFHGDLPSVVVEEVAGYGLTAQVNGKPIKLGRRSWATDEMLPDHADCMEMVLSVEGQNPVVFLFRDELRSDASDVVQQLKNKGLTIHLLSGDRQDIVATVAQHLGIENFQSAMTPEQKFAFLEQLHAQGHKVMMVGDGINDAPILAGADVSVSPASGIDIARNASNVVFTGEALAPIVKLLDTGRFSQKLVQQNFVLTFIYNILAVPLAVAGFVTPLIAALAMSGSSLVVTLNAFRLRRLK
jgi:Cu2+-exporting ATPase